MSLAIEALKHWLREQGVAGSNPVTPTGIVANLDF
jgi:hypothetical protein